MRLARTAIRAHPSPIYRNSLIKPTQNRHIMSNTASSSSTSAPPPASPSLLPRVKLSGLQGMQTLDPSAFVIRIPVLSARVDPAGIGELKRHPMLRGWFAFGYGILWLGWYDRQLIDIRKALTVVPVPDSTDKHLRLRVDSEGELCGNCDMNDTLIREINYLLLFESSYLRELRGMSKILSS